MTLERTNANCYIPMNILKFFNLFSALSSLSVFGMQFATKGLIAMCCRIAQLNFRKTL